MLQNQIKQTSQHIQQDHNTSSMRNQGLRANTNMLLLLNNKRGKAL